MTTSLRSLFTASRWKTAQPAQESASAPTRFETYLQTLRAKWVELPPGNDDGERQFSTDLLEWSDEKLLAYWNEQAKFGESVRGWYRRLYAPLFNGKRVLEIGSGMGYDGVFFIEHGAEWQFSDIVDSNQQLIQRIVAAKGCKPMGFLVIEALGSFDNLPNDFDFVWANGSLMSLPFDLAAEESRAILSHLKPSGRWIELAYPYERWVREGAPPFSEWGKMTDGETTPWMEWYDLERLKQRLGPHIMAPVLDMRFYSDAYIWLDLEHTGREAPPPMQEVQIPSPGVITTPDHIWHYAQTIPLTEHLRDAEGNVSADIVCRVKEGAVGFAFANEAKNAFTGREQIIDARPSRQRRTITGNGAETRWLVIRNASGHGASSVEVESISLRSAL